MPNVKIYTTESCAYCKMAKEFFAEKNVEYEAKDVTEDQAAREEMIQKSGQMGVPVIVVDQSTLDTIVDIEAFVTAPTFHHPEKLARYKDLLREHADLSGFSL